MLTCLVAAAVHWSQVRNIGLVFELAEYALSSRTEILPGGGVALTLIAPATIWSAQVLRLRGDLPTNDFEAKVVSAYLRSCGLSSRVVTSFPNKNEVRHEFSGLIRDVRGVAEAPAPTGWLSRALQPVL